MAALYLVAPPAVQRPIDAAGPQPMANSDFACQSGGLWAIVHSGRTQAVCTSGRGPACCTALQENRSRGCRAPRSFCRCAWLPSWQLALASRKKSFTWISRFRSSRPTPASTSKTIGRAFGAVQARPALFLSAVADSATATPELFEQSLAGRYAGGVLPLIQRRLSCGPLPSSPLLPCRLSRPARALRPSLNRFPSPSNPRRPASTAPDIPERACRGDRPAPVPARRAPAKEVRPC